MRHIEKSLEPCEYSDWKSRQTEDWIPCWNNFQNPEKDIVKKSLLKEQGYICCFCEMQLENIEKCEIEHIIPRHVVEKYKKTDLDYDNFAACCYGGSKDKKPRVMHCDKAKDSWYNPALFVSPLQGDCKLYFKFESNGNILCSDDPKRRKAADMTIRKLGLDVQKLNDLRKAAIDVFLFVEPLERETIIKLVDRLERRNADGMYVEFCSAIIYNLNALLNSNQ